MKNVRRLAARPVKAIARWAGVPLAEDGFGATYRTDSDDPWPLGTESDDGQQERLDEAKAKFARWKDADPFPLISPALLNSADIDDYMRETAMVFPYFPDDLNKRKTASYALSVGTEIAYWNPKNPAKSPIRVLKKGDAVVIPSNSLIYVRTAELFQLPNYIAVRFNLHIDLVHKGLLLGTGPLVDPGFFGRLMVPLHNLTSNTYVLSVGDDFIWAEFTKTSMTDRWKQQSADIMTQSGALVPFPERKTDKSLADYVNNARRGHPILQPGLNHTALQNAIPEAIDRTRRIAEKAKTSAAKSARRANQLRNWVSGLGLIALLGAAYGLASEIEANRSSMQATLGLVKGTDSDLEKQEARIKDLELNVSKLEKSANNKSGINHSSVN